MHSPSSARRLLLIVIAVAVIVRIGSAIYQGPDIQPMPGVTDQISYHELAIRVIKGHGFSFATGWWPATRANEPTAHWSFLYTLFLSAVYSVFGPLPLAARLVQAVLVGILHPLLVWRIGARLFGPTVGLASAALTAVYGYFVFYGGSLVTESLYILAFLWVLDLSTALAYASSRGRRLPAISHFVLLGVALGVAALLRQVFLLVVPVILLWIAWQFSQRHPHGRPSMAALAGRITLTMAILLAFVLPWTVRNYKAFGEVVLLNTNSGFVFYWGNHPVHGDNFIPILSYGSTNYGTMLPRDVGGLNEAQLDRELLKRGLGFVTADPGRYARLSLSRVKEYVKFWPTSDSSTSSNFIRVASFGLCLPLLVLGIFQAARRDHVTVDERNALSGVVLLLGVATVYSLVHLLTWTLVRYRLPVDAILMPFAGLSLVSLLHRVFSQARVSQIPLPSSAN
jgi:hypothetical protein